MLFGFKKLRLFKDDVGFRDKNGRKIKVDDIIRDPSDNYTGTVSIKREMREYTSNVTGFYIATSVQFGTRQMEECINSYSSCSEPAYTRLERIVSSR